MAGLIATVVAGALAAALLAALRTTQVTKALASDATEAAVIGAYLTRDGRAVASVDLIPDDHPNVLDGSLGVSIIDPLDCIGSTTADMVVRLSWPSSEGGSTVVTYALESAGGLLIRTACELSGSDLIDVSASVILGRGFTSVTTDCDPTDCSGLPELLTVTLTAGSGDEPLRYSLTAGLRTDARPGPVSSTDVSVAVLGDERCPTLDLRDGGQVRAADDVVVDATCVAPLHDGGGQLSVGGSVVLADSLADPYAGVLPLPERPADTGDVNPAPLGSNESPASVIIHPRPVTVSADTVFDPGVYVFERGLTIESGAHVTGTDVMWFVEGGMSVAPSASLDLEAPDSGPYRGISVWAATDDPVVIGNEERPSSLDGAIYAPDAHVTIFRRAGVCLDTIIASSLTFAGNGPAHVGYGTDPCDTTASLWTPAAFGPRLLLWLDGADGSSLTVNAADAISQWNDRSGAGDHARQDQSLAQPTWETGSINGLAAARFDGVDDSLDLDGSLLVDRQYSIAAVARRTSARPSNMYLGGSGTELALGWEASESLGHQHADTWNRADVEPFVAGAGAQVHLVSTSLSTRLFRVDGAPHTASGGVEPLESWPDASVGSSRGSSFEGYVGEIVVVDGALSSAELSRLEGYLAWKWGTSRSLPLDHLHSTVPPLSYTPSAPPEVTAIAGDGDAAITWSAPTASGSRSADHFVIQVASDGDFTSPITVDASRSASETNALTANLLANDVPMWVRVAGSNEWGVGPFATAGPFTPRDYRSAVLAGAPTGYWRLGEPSGEVVYDESAAQSHGDVVGATMSVAGAVAAAADTAIGLDGATTRVEIELPSTLLPSESGTTISVWFRSGQSGVVLARSDGATTTPLLYIGEDRLVRSSFALTADPPDDTIATAGPLSDQTWHHVVATSDGSTLRLHLDGTLVGTAYVPSVAPGAAQTVLVLGGTTVGPGWPSAPTAPFSGEVDELSVYPRSLTAPEVATLYRSGVTGENDLVAPPAPEPALRPAPSRVTVSWELSETTDVVGYRLFRNGLLIRQQSTADPVTDIAYADDTDSVYALEAYDSRGNRSSLSSRTARPMVLTVDTSRSAGTTVSLPLRGAVDAVVDWQGTCATAPPTTTTEVVDSARTLDVSCVYVEPGVYTVRVFGTVAQYGFGTQSGSPPIMPSQEKIVSVSEWGDLGTISLVGAFVRAANLVAVPPELPSTVIDTSHMFQRTGSFNQDLGGWDTSNVTAMSYMFQYATIFNNGCASGTALCPSIGSWNMSKVTRTDRMFESANAFNQNIGAWDMSSVTTLQAMFYAVTGSNPTFNNGCAPGVSSATCATIGSWDTRKVVSLRTTFFSASAFNQNISGWDTSKVTSLYQTFAQASRFDQPIGTWNVSNVQTMWRAFNGAASFDQDLAGWNTARVTDMIDMFRNASRFNRDLSGWCVSLIRSTPSNFATGATSWQLPKPIWGTCPTR